MCFIVYQDAPVFIYYNPALEITDENLQQVHGRNIFVDYAKMKPDFRTERPIARGPPVADAESVQ